MTAFAAISILKLDIHPPDLPTMSLKQTKIEEVHRVNGRETDGIEVREA
jgi:hypothetical protein